MKKKNTFEELKQMLPSQVREKTAAAPSGKSGWVGDKVKADLANRKKDVVQGLGQFVSNARASGAARMDNGYLDYVRRATGVENAKPGSLVWEKADWEGAKILPTPADEVLRSRIANQQHEVTDDDLTRYQAQLDSLLKISQDMDAAYQAALESYVGYHGTKETEAENQRRRLEFVNDISLSDGINNPSLAQLIEYDKIINGENNKSEAEYQAEYDRIRKQYDDFITTADLEEWVKGTPVAEVKAPDDYESKTKTIQAFQDFFTAEQNERAVYNDFFNSEENLALRSSSTYERDSVFNRISGMEADGMQSNMDALYMWVNDYGFRNAYEAKHDYWQSVSGNPDAPVHKDTDSVWKMNGYDMMSDQEIADFNAAYMQSEEAAQRYLSSLAATGVLNRRRAEMQTYSWEEIASNPLAGSEDFWSKYVGAPMADAAVYLAGVAGNFESGLQAPAQIAGTLMGYDSNSWLFDTNRMTSTLRGTQAKRAGEALDVPILGTTLGELLYNGSTALVDNLVAVGLSGAGLADDVAAKMAVRINQAIMSSQAASNTLYNELESGSSNVGAVLKSLLTAAIEAATEKYSMEALLSDPTNTIGYVLRNMAAEGSEEAAADLLSIPADALVKAITGDATALDQTYNSYLLQGYSSEEARSATFTNYLQNLGADTLIGGLVGGVSSAPTAISTHAQGKKIQESDLGEQLSEIAQQMPEGSKSRRMFEAVTKTGSKFATAQLYNALHEEMPSQSREVLDNISAAQMARQLKKDGETGDATAIAKGVLKVLRGETLTEEESQAIAQSSKGVEMMDRMSRTDERDRAEIRAYNEAYNAGYYGQEATSGMRQTYYRAGVEAAKQAEQKRLNRVGKVGLKDGGVSYIGAAMTDADVRLQNTRALDQATMARLNQQQKDAVYALRVVSKATGIRFALYEGQADASGNITVDNGKFDSATNTIFLDLNSGKNRADQGVVNYAVLRTASHEMTHFIEKNSPEGYASLKNFIQSELTARGQDMGALVRSKQEMAERQGRMLTREAAVAEVVADACEMMLQDTQAIHRLAQKDKSLFGKIKRFLNQLMDKISKALEGVDATHTEARALREAGKYIEGLQQLWDSALVEAVETARSVQETEAESLPVEERSETVQVLSEAVDENGDTMMSLRSMEEDYDTYRGMLKTAGASEADINALFDTIDAVMDAVRANRAKLDFGENISRESRSFFPIKPNSDPLYKVSLDFSSLCRKRLLQQAVQERLETKYDTVLTKAERVAVRQALLEVQKEGLRIEVACALCYVEAARLKSPAQIARFMDNKRANLVDYFSKASADYATQIAAKVDQMTAELGYEVGTPMSQMKPADKKKVQAAKKAMYPAYKPTAAEEAIIRTAESLPESMYKTEKGLWQLKREHPEIFTAYTTFVRNATKSKGIEGDTPFYAGDTATISDGLIEAMNAENGTRSQSWSDFRVIHVLDYMAAIIEFSTRNAKMQTYTKVPDFVKLMGNTGMMINLSLIPTDYDGQLNFDPVEGMPYAIAQELRDIYHGSVGNISIGISDNHIIALLANGDIDYVIPYHKSSMDKKTRDAIGLKKWSDYESSQNEKQRDYPDTNRDGGRYHKAPRFSEWYNHSEAVAIAKAAQASAPAGDKTYGARMAMREMAERYKQLCHERGLQEKFPQFAQEENYWKLLIDRKMIDQVTGELIEQKAVKPVFNKADILEILSDEVARFDQVNADFEEAAARIDEMWAKGDIRKAAKSKTIVDQVSAFEDAVIVRNIAASAENTEDVQFSTREVSDSFSLRETSTEELTDEYLANLNPADMDTEADRLFLQRYQTRRQAYLETQDDYEKASSHLRSLTGDELLRQRERVKLLKAKMARARADLDNQLRNPGMRRLYDATAEFVRENIQGKTSEEIAQMIADTEAEVERMSKLVDDADDSLIKAKKNLRWLKANATKKLREAQTIKELSHKSAGKVNHIRNVVRRLHSLRAQETDYKNIPEDLKAFVGDVVKLFGNNFGSTVWSHEQADKVVSLYTKLNDANGPYAEIAPFYDEDMLGTLQALSEWAKKYEQLSHGKGMTRLERAQLRFLMNEAVADLVDHVNAIVRNSRDMFIAGRKQQFAQISAEVRDELLEREDKRVLLGKAGDTMRMLDNLIRTGNITPVYFFDQLGNEALKSLFNDFRRGQEEYAFARGAAQETIERYKDQYHYDAWKDADKLTFKTAQGHTITLTKEQALWLYATWKRERSNEIAATEHLTRGGFVYESNADPDPANKLLQNGTLNTTGHLIAESDMAVVDGYLTQEQKDYADAMVGYLSNDMAELGNRVSMEMFGIRKYKEKYYFPFKTVSDQLNQKSTAGSTATTDDSRLKHSPHTHRLTNKARTALVMGNFSEVVAHHISQMATYSNFVLPIENMNRVLNHKFETEDGSQTTIRSMIRQKYGENALEYIENFIRDMNGGERYKRRKKWLDIASSMHKKAMVAASLSVTLQQPSSILRAGVMMDPKYLMKAVGSKPDYEQLKQYSGVAIIKQAGRFDVGVGKSDIEWLLEGNDNGLTLWQKAKQALNPKEWDQFKNRWSAIVTGLPSKADEWAWSVLWNAVKREQADLHKDMDANSHEFLAMCGERFNDIVDHTQVYDSLLVKSDTMRSKDSIDKMMTSFASEPTLTLNILYDAFANKNHPDQKKRIWSAMLYTTLSSLAAAIGSALISAWNKDDDDRTAWEKLLNKTVDAFIGNVNPLENIPYVRDVWSLLQGYEVERTDMSLLSDLAAAIDKLRSNNYTGFRKVEEMAGSIANVFGIPVKNVMRDMRRIYNAALSDWGKPTEIGIENAWKSALDDAFPFADWYENKKEDFAYRAVNAYRTGDKATAEDIIEYLSTVQGTKDKDIRTAMKSAVKDMYLAGGISREDGIKALLTAYPDAFNANDLYWNFDEWDAEKAGEISEGESYSKYLDFYRAVETGTNLKAEIQRYLDTGVKKETLSNMITNHYKPQLTSLYKTNKAEASNLQARLLTAYTALGYDREKKLKDIKKWYE